MALPSTSWSDESLGTDSWSDESLPVAEIGYLVDHLGNYITDHLGNKIIVNTGASPWYDESMASSIWTAE